MGPRRYPVALCPRRGHARDAPRTLQTDPFAFTSTKFVLFTINRPPWKAGRDRMKFVRFFV
jgi:hypothetical protein